MLMIDRCRETEEHYTTGIKYIRGIAVIYHDDRANFTGLKLGKPLLTFCHV